jgi:predicted secreted protein
MNRKRNRIKTVFLCMAMGAMLCMSGCGKKAVNYQVKLDGNMTTGYAWTYTMGEEGIVKEVENVYEDKDGEDIAGGGGTFIFEFKGEKEGQVQLDFSYARSWEENVAPEDTKSYILTVDANGNVTGEEAASEAPASEDTAESDAADAEATNDSK